MHEFLHVALFNSLVVSQAVLKYHVVRHVHMLDPVQSLGESIKSQLAAELINSDCMNRGTGSNEGSLAGRSSINSDSLGRSLIYRRCMSFCT